MRTATPRLKIHIALDATPLLRAPDGVGVYTAELIKALLASDPNLRITAIGFKGDEHQPSLIKDSRLDWFYLPWRRKIYRGLAKYFGTYLDASKHFKAPVDLMLHSDFFVWPRLSRARRTAVVIHDLAYLDYPESVSKRNRRALRLLIPVSLARADTILTVSENTVKRLRAVYDLRKPAVVAYPGIDTKRFTPQTGQNDRQIVERYGLKGEYLLFLGTLEPRKNIDGLITAYTHLPRELTDKYALVLAGSRGWNDFEIQSIMADAREKGYRILTPGKVAFDDLPALYRSASAFAFLSHYEGFGIPPLEAMACGTPVVASDIPPIRESLGDYALFVKPDDQKSATAAIEKILTDKKLREKLIPKGIARAATFDWQTSARKILALARRSS